MENFADLLSDAFSETSVPSFPEGDLDFENLNFEEGSEEDGAKQATAKKNEVLLQEATGETTVLLDEDDKNVLCMTENAYKEPANDETNEEDGSDVGVKLLNMAKTPQEEDYISSDGESEEEDSTSGDDEEDDEDVGKPGDLKEDRIFVEGQPLVPESLEKPQEANKGQGEAENDEVVSYFGKVPEQSHEMMIRGAATEEDEQESDEEDQEDSSDPESYCVKPEEEENPPNQQLEPVTENPDCVDPRKDSLEFPCLSRQNLQDLIAEVDGEECVEKMKDFSGEEHQEAGESFADYPSDFSSCEYVEDKGRKQDSQDKLNTSSETSDYGSCPRQNRDGTDEARTSSIEDFKENESTDLEFDTDGLMSLDVAGGQQDMRQREIVELVLGDTELTGCDDREETGDSDSYSSSDESFQVRASDEDFYDEMDPLELKTKKQLDDTRLHGASSAVFSSFNDHLLTNTRVDPADFVSWDFDVLKSDSLLSELTTVDADKSETLLSGVNRHLAVDINSYSVLHREETTTMSSSFKGSLDDGFFFNTGSETPGVTEHQGDDEYEGERNWEQEQERIKAFYEYYDDSDEDSGRQGRQIKVQFCADPLSHVIHYETDSDRDSLSSSTDREQDLNSEDTSDEVEVPDNIQQTKPECDPPNIQRPDGVPDLCNTQTHTGQRRCFSTLKLMLKMAVVTVAGLLMFWLAIDQPDWLSQLFYF